MRSNGYSKSTLLTKFIGIPNVCAPDTSQLTDDNFSQFLKLAKKNKVSFLFLKNVKSKVANFPESLFLSYEEQYNNAVGLTKFVAAHLKEAHVPYTFFKTIKPFPYLPSDVDVLLFSNNDLTKVIKSLENQGCKVLDGDAYGVTMYSPEYNLNIDLTTQIAVTGLSYVDKFSLLDHVVNADFHGTKIRSLSPASDLLVVTAHSILKEQMFTLSDYYFLVMLVKHWTEAANLAQKFYLTSALKTIFSMTAALTVNVFGPTNPLMDDFSSLGITHVVDYDKNFELPKKYALDTILVEFLRKIKDPSTTNSLPSAVKSFFTPDFYIKALTHITRKKY